MKLSLLLFAGLLCLPLASTAQNAPAKPLGSADTEWPGVHLDLTQIARLDDTHILVAVKIRGDATLKNPVKVCGQDHSTEANPFNTDPYTLNTATLTDQATGKTYKADGSLPGKPYWGDPDIIATIRLNTWLQLAVKFDVPPPVLTPDGKKMEQKVTFLLPKAKAPIKNVVLPQSDASYAKRPTSI